MVSLMKSNICIKEKIIVNNIIVPEKYSPIANEDKKSSLKLNPPHPPFRPQNAAFYFCIFEILYSPKESSSIFIFNVSSDELFELFLFFSNDKTQIIEVGEPLSFQWVS